MEQTDARFLRSPGRSKVTLDELYREVGEYFDIGVRVKAGDTVIDVGANIGAFALRAAEATDGDLRIFAFEPSPDTFAALKANYATNPLLRKTKHRLFHAGLSDRAGDEISFYDFARFPTNSTFHLSEKRREMEIFFEDRGRRMRSRIERALPVVGRSIGALVDGAVSSMPKGSVGWWMSRQVMGIREHRVRIDTLPHALADENIDRIHILKIDVEGPELEILRGLDEPTWKKVDQVVCETHNRDGRLTEIENLLKAHGLDKIERHLQKTIDNGLESILLLGRR